jgi:PAS domain S-box-containing protein
MINLLKNIFVLTTETAVRNSEIWPIKFAVSSQAHIRLVFFVAVSVFICEAFVMIILSFLHPLPIWFAVLLDSTLLIILLSPVLYFGLFRSLVHYINERKKAEKTFKESEERFRIVFQTSPDAISVTKLEDGLYVDANQGFTDLTGYTREDLDGKTSLDIDIWFDSKDRDKLVLGIQNDGQVKNLESKFIVKDGNVLTGLLSAKLIMLNGEQHILAVTRDISELKKAEAERLQKEKMQGVLEMAGAACHELNQPMTVIKAYSELLLRRISEDHIRLGMARKIKQEIDRMTIKTKKIMHITKYETKNYVQGVKIIDIDKSSNEILFGD